MITLKSLKPVTVLHRRNNPVCVAVDGKKVQIYSGYFVLEVERSDVATEVVEKHEALRLNLRTKKDPGGNLDTWEEEYSGKWPEEYDYDWRRVYLGATQAEPTSMLRQYVQIPVPSSKEDDQEETRELETVKFTSTISGEARYVFGDFINFFKDQLLEPKFMIHSGQHAGVDRPLSIWDGKTLVGIVAPLDVKG